jgi:hypothetical protein
MRVTDEKCHLLPLSEVCTMVAASTCTRVAAEVSRLFCCLHSAGNGRVSFSSGCINLAIDAGRNVHGRTGHSAGQQLSHNADKAAAFQQSSSLTNQGVDKTPWSYSSDIATAKKSKRITFRGKHFPSERAEYSER